MEKKYILPCSVLEYLEKKFQIPASGNRYGRDEGAGPKKGKESNINNKNIE